MGISHVEGLLTIYAALGAMLTLFGIIYLAASSELLTTETRLGLLVGVTGMMLSISSGLLASRLTRRTTRTASDASDDLAGELVRTWAQFEAVGIQAAAGILGESKARKLPLAELIVMTTKYRLLSQDDRDFTRRMLDRRNRVVHQNERFSGKEARRDIARLRAIVQKLSEGADAT
jgi:hypothetical protein